MKIALLLVAVNIFMAVYHGNIHSAIGWVLAAVLSVVLWASERER